MKTAKEYRKSWQQLNPHVIHIPSEHEANLMESYAKYYHALQLEQYYKQSINQLKK